MAYFCLRPTLMDQRVSSMVAPFYLILIVSYFLIASGNTEVKALYAFKLNLVDPNGVLRTWDPTLINPCSWDHIECSADNSAILVRLGHANLTGILAPQLGDLRNLHSLDLHSNNFIGTIPYELGNLTKLVTLDLSLNNLTGPIPDTLGNLKHLRTLRLNNNSFTGEIPKTLTTLPALQVIDLSYNNLSGVIPFNSSTQFTPISFAGNPALTMPEAGPPPSLPSGNSATTTIAGGAASLCAAVAFALSWW